MIREFKFFHGITIQTEGIQNIVRTLRARWEPEPLENLNAIHAIDAEAELTRILVNEITTEWDNNVIDILSEQISREVDEEIIRTITRTWNGGQRA